jgi:predicted HTH transcriptional regulator
MISTIDELLDHASKGILREHTFPNVELKRSWDQRYGEKISGLGNQVENQVSWIAIGIEDDGKLAGFDEQKIIKEEEKVSQHINNCLDPVQACLAVKTFEVAGRWILVIKIANPGALVKWNHTAYKKAGTTIVAMRPDEEMELTIKLPGLSDFSKQTFDGPIDSGLVDSFMMRLRARRTDLSPGDIERTNSDDMLSSIRINRTNTSAILFGDYQYRVVFYDEGESPVTNTARFGLYGLLENSFVPEIQKWAEFPAVSANHPPFPEHALKEALANAVAHAAYFEHNGEIIIEVFKDRVVISNLCLPETGYFANKWFSRSHKTVNGLLMETLRLAGLVDELGRGKNVIFADSIKEGKRPPYVSLERTGRFDRWRLCLYGGVSNSIQLRLFHRLREIYHTEQKALIAHALILWNNEPVSQIRQYIDSESVPLFAEVLRDLDGPIFFYEKEDKVVLQRWVRVLLEEGKDSKSFTTAEEEQLYRFVYEMQSRYYNFIVTTKELRKLAHMGDTKSEIVLSSTLLKKWVNEKKVDKIKKGVYKFKDITPKVVQLNRLLDLLQEKKM